MIFNHTQIRLTLPSFYSFYGEQPGMMRLGVANNIDQLLSGFASSPGMLPQQGVPTPLSAALLASPYQQTTPLASASGGGGGTTITTPAAAAAAAVSALPTSDLLAMAARAQSLAPGLSSGPAAAAPTAAGQVSIADLLKQLQAGNKGGDPTKRL